jgi:hypothetical protein
MMRKHIYLFIFAGFFLLYAATAQRGVSWQDSGEFQYRALVHDYSWVSGIAIAHPAYIVGADLFSSLFPVSCRVYTINLFSGLGMVIALMLLARLLTLLQFKNSTVLLTVLTLGLSHMAWWLSTIAEVYTWSLAFLMAELLCVAKLCGKDSGLRVQGSREESMKQLPQQAPKDLYLWLLLALINGLHASFHNFAFLNLPVYGVLFLYLQWRKSLLQSTAFLFLTACAWFIGACLLVALFLLEWSETHSFTSTLKSLFFSREFETVVAGTRAINWSLAKMNLALACISFVSPVWLFVCFAGRNRKTYSCFKLSLLGLTALHFFFWIRYFVPDQATFLLPTLGLLAIWAGIGLDSVTFGRKQLPFLATAILLCALATPLLLHHILLVKQGGVKRVRQLPFRDESSYWLYPWKQNERSAASFIEEVRKLLKAGDLLIADNTAAGPVMAAQAAGLLSPKIRNITFFTGETEAELLTLVEKQERVYIVSPVPGYASPALLTDQFTFKKEGVLYRVRKVRHD